MEANYLGILTFVIVIEGYINFVRYYDIEEEDWQSKTTSYFQSRT